MVITASFYHAILAERKQVSLASHLARVSVSSAIKKGSWTRSLGAIKSYDFKEVFIR